MNDVNKLEEVKDTKTFDFNLVSIFIWLTLYHLINIITLTNVQFQLDPNPTDFNAVKNHRNLKHFNAYHLKHHKNTFKDQCLQRRPPLVSKQSTREYPCFAECYGITYVSD